MPPGVCLIDAAARDERFGDRNDERAGAAHADRLRKAARERDVARENRVREVRRQAPDHGLRIAAPCGGGTAATRIEHAVLAGGQIRDADLT